MTAHFVDPDKALATELLHEVKMSARRWFIAFIIMTVVVILTIGIFIDYISQRKNTNTYYKQNSRQINTINSELVQNIGGDYGKSETDKSSAQEKSIKN